MDYDIFLGGPPDRRAPFPYKAMIKAAFSDLKIYDWEEYKGNDYQEQNHKAIKQSGFMISLVPSFPLPGIGPEIGYFYCWHEQKIKQDPSIKRIILIWPDSVQPDFAKKTLAQYGLIVPTVEEAIAYLKSLGA